MLDDQLITKWCNKCKAMLAVRDFYSCKTARDGLSSYCAFHIRENTKESFRRRRVRAIEAMGGKCTRCGFNDDPRALQIDHVNGDGWKESSGKNSHKTYREHDTAAYYAKVLANPDKYQLLCANCNVIKRWEEKESTGPKHVPRVVPQKRLALPRNMKKFAIPAKAGLEEATHAR